MRIFGGQSPEKQIAKRLLDGDRNAVQDLYTLFGDYLAGICARYLAEEDDRKDVLQDSLIRIIERSDSFRWRGEGSLKAWAGRITANTAVSLLRSKARFQEQTLDPDAPIAEPEPPPVSDIPPEALREMILSLPPGYRAVFNLYVIEGLGHDEISRQLGIAPDSSASQLLRAKRLLVKKINEYRQCHDIQ